MPPSPHAGTFDFILNSVSAKHDLAAFLALLNGIVSDIETIRMDEIDTACDRMLASDVKYRFVIDRATL